MESPRQSRPARGDVLTALALSLLGMALVLFRFGERSAAPCISDERVYLFQARALLEGHLSFPSPPLPSFFEAANLLVVPRFAGKYFPGHPAALAPFLKLGIPEAWPILALGLQTVALYACLRLLSARRVTAALGIALLLGSGLHISVFATYLSNSTSSLCVALFLLFWSLQRPSPSPLWSGLIGVTAGYALLTRPLTGFALCAVGSGLLLITGWQRRSERKLRFEWASFAASLLLFGLAGAASNSAVTGSAIESPWSLYAREYMPYDAPGIGPLPTAAPERELPPHLRAFAENLRESRAEHTLAHLPIDVLIRARELFVDYPPSGTVTMLGIAGVAWLGGQALLPLFLLVLFFALQSLFHFHGLHYWADPYPALIVLAGLGAEGVLRLIDRFPRPATRSLLRIGAGAAAALSLVSCVIDQRDRHALGAKWREPTERFERALEGPRREHALVFLRYPADWDGNLELTYNDPDLEHAEVVLARDLGNENARLEALFPARPVYLLDLGSFELMKSSTAAR